MGIIKNIGFLKDFIFKLKISKKPLKSQSLDIRINKAFDVG